MLDQPNLDKIDHEHLLSLYGIMRAMNSSLDFGEVLNTVLDSMMEVTRAQRGFLMIADDQSGRLRIQVARTLDGDPAEESYSTTIVNEVVATGQPLLTNNAQFDTRYKAGQSIIMKGLRAILCAPMMVKDRLVGIVYVDTSIRTGSFKESDLFLLSVVAGQAAVAIENARLYRVAVEKGRLERELQMAREIQRVAAATPDAAASRFRDSGALALGARSGGRFLRRLPAVGRHARRGDRRRVGQRRSGSIIHGIGA